MEDVRREPSREPEIPFTERLKSIPGFFGIHMNEEPHYTVAETDENFELREYPPMLVAKVRVWGRYENAKEEAFKKLASYIFGENRESQKMAMTSPVFIQDAHLDAAVPTHDPVRPVRTGWDTPSEESRRMLEEAAALGREGSLDGIEMSFVLPADVSGRTAPFPQDKDIHLLEVPRQTWAVLQYSGVNSQDEIQEKTRELENWLDKRLFKFDRKTLRVAQYDSPNTIPALRKNEVQIQLWSARLDA